MFVLWIFDSRVMSLHPKAECPLFEQPRIILVETNLPCFANKLDSGSLPLLSCLASLARQSDVGLHTYVSLPWLDNRHDVALATDH